MKDNVNLSSKLRAISLFSGVGGLEKGVEQVFEIETVAYVEQNPYCQAALIRRMQEGHLSPGLIYDDVCEFDGRKYRGRVDFILGGFPCQDISQAGRGAGIQRGNRSGLWFEMLRIISEVRPRVIFMENSPKITGRGLDKVLGGLSEVGYDAVWTTLSAWDCGASHGRERWFCLAYKQKEKIPYPDLFRCLYRHATKQSTETREQTLDFISSDDEKKIRYPVRKRLSSGFKVDVGEISSRFRNRIFEQDPADR